MEVKRIAQGTRGRFGGTAFVEPQSNRRIWAAKYVFEPVHHDQNESKAFIVGDVLQREVIVINGRQCRILREAERY